MACVTGADDLCVIVSVWCEENVVVAGLAKISGLDVGFFPIAVVPLWQLTAVGR